VITVLCVIASLVAVGEAPANLRDHLLASNFNLYSAPSSAGNLVLQDLNGKTVSLSGFRGKVVILNFWKIDCPPCSVEKPVLERVYRKFRERGLEILAVNLFDGHDRFRSYAQRSGFTFTFANDPAKRLTLRQQKVGTSLPTTFVMNANSEAIYEIPGVPTTYVVNRNGQVIGSSVGLINWEEAPFQELLESLLGTPNEIVRGPAFDEPALQGAGARFVSMNEEETAAGTLLAQQVPAAQESPTVLPFQGPTRGPVAGPVSQPVPPVVGGQTPPAAPAATQPAAVKPQTAKPAAAAQPKKKPVQQTGLQGEKTDLRKPKPFKPAAPGATAVQTQQGARTPLAAPAQPRPASVPVSPPPLASTPGGLPTLPPAIPYNPNAPNAPGTLPGAPIVPDENGTVTARIPGVQSNAAPLQAQSSPSSLPSAQPVGTQNPIDGFILDSFRQTAGQAQPPKPLRVQSEDKPAASVIDQVGRDFRQLGSGLRDTFSRILPGR